MPEHGRAGETRPFIQVWFACAGIYQKVFRDHDGRSYTARCAKCGKAARFVVGPGGTSQRKFELSC